MIFLLLASVLAAAAALFVVLPLLERSTALVADAAPGEVLDAEARKRVALASLKELEYDFLAGKLDDADYRSQRDLLSGEALRAIRTADEVAERWDGNAAVGAKVKPASRLDAALAAEAGRHACGFVNATGSRFCAGCGARLR
ncbi:MAG TPA: zinc ribbon domain-containing protein [Longimicrobiaceae bacterium]|nr:zinc ribbon domain-containing protein [Longimicrobiaceae bacterium]